MEQRQPKSQKPELALDRRRRYLLGLRRGSSLLVQGAFRIEEAGERTTLDKGIEQELGSRRMKIDTG